MSDDARLQDEPTGPKNAPEIPGVAQWPGLADTILAHVEVLGGWGQVTGEGDAVLILLPSGDRLGRVTLDEATLLRCVQFYKKANPAEEIAKLERLIGIQRARNRRINTQTSGSD